MSFRFLSRCSIYFLRRNVHTIVPPWNIVSAHFLKIGKYASSNPRTGFALAVGLLNFFHKDDETSEDKLINAIKRSILCIQRREYDKAEQMLHIALRMAQDMQNKDGITYVYDVMANLALEREQLDKAANLFVDVMRRLFANGYTDNNSKILHISSKLAHVEQLRGNIDKAMQGFKWTLSKIEQKLENDENQGIRELWGLTRNWYGHLLMDMKNYSEAKECFVDAYNIITEIHGNHTPEAILVLNNLTVAYSNLRDFSNAWKALQRALTLAEYLPELAGILKVNAGLLYMKQGLLYQAKESCSTAWRLGKKLHHDETVKQADNCLKLINEFEK